MQEATVSPTVEAVHGPPKILQVIGFAALAAILASTLFTDPRPGLSGDGLLVTLATVAMLAGFALAMPPLLNRIVPGLGLIAAATLTFAAVQPDGAGFAGVYFVVVIGGMALGPGAAVVICGGTVVGLIAIELTQGENPAVVSGLVFSILPWFFVMRLVRRLVARTQELAETRAAHAEAAAQAERGRVARELHDVLAHSLSALALHLEGARLMAKDRDPELSESLERAHRLAVSGLSEARQAISALRGDDLPGLEDLADAFEGATLTVTGTPREPSSEAKLALYRTAQEALTNVRRHSRAPERVDLHLDYASDGTTLTVADHGEAAPTANGSGYGLTGMRERAELLGGRLDAGPTDDGFRVRLWLPA
jgi:signal transduction histidine kinase